MSAFLTRLRTEILPPSEVKGRQIYLLVQDFVVDSNLMGRIVIPAGFKTDFASIPRAAFWYIDPEDPVILYASVVHDWLYSMVGKLADGRIFTRAQADLVLVEFMALSGARIDQRKIVHFAVEKFGGAHWNNQIAA